MMTPEEISKLAFLLYPHVVRAAPEGATAESLAARINELKKGLMPEDEFATTVCWLGNCAGIHRIGQAPMPVPDRPEMRAPDFIAFPLVNGCPLPVLIEVKSSHHNAIKWSERYRRSLLTFADCLKLPLLVAWRCGELWFLIDHRHFARNATGYRLTLEQAFREDLSCLLFRNLRIQMNPDLEFVLDIEILDEVEGDADTILPEGTLRMQITKAAFYCRGALLNDKNSPALSLFLASPDETEFRRTGKQTCRNISRPKDQHGFSLSNVLTAQLSLGNATAPLDWHRILAAPLPSCGRKLRESLPNAIERQFVRYVMDIIPNTWPEFLPDKTAFLAERREQRYT
jgi:hypothetical protein